MKRKKTICGQTLVKNEGRFIWFAVKSVIDHLDRLLIWDTGSTDSTVEIIKILQEEYPQKIIFKEIGEVTAEEITHARQKMLDETKSDWFLILDGDEVWWDSSINLLCKTIEKEGDGLKAIIVPTYNIVGDVYHYQEERAGQYNFLGKRGHMNLRAINRNIPGLHLKNNYPLEGYYDKDQNLLQNFADGSIKFLEAPIMHLTHLERSSISNGGKVTLQRAGKLKYEIGLKFPKDFKYPESFYLNRPKEVASPWNKMDTKYKLRAVLETPLKRLKRRILK